MLDIQVKLERVLNRLQWMEVNKIWPNGKRYLWTDAHGLMLLVSLYKYFNDEKYMKKSEELVLDVKRVLKRPKGYRIGQDPDRDGQYFHYLTKWMFALNELGKVKPEYKKEAIQLVKEIHPHFYTKDGIWWKMKEDLSGPYPGYGFGGLDFYDAYSTYRSIDPDALKDEINDVFALVSKNYKRFDCSQDLGLGESLWMAHRYKNEDWADFVIKKSLERLDRMWNPKGFFVRDLYFERYTILAFGNFGVSVGIQSVGVWQERVDKMQAFFETFKSGDKYDTDAITHVMYCNSLIPGVLIENELKDSRQ